MARVQIPTLAEVDAKVDKSKSPINVKDSPYSAVGNGTADDTTAIKNATDDARNAGRAVYIPAGTYKVSNSITTAGNSNRLVLFGDGPGLTEFTMAAGMTNPVVSAIGALGTAIAVTSASSPGDYILTITSTAGLSAGQYVRLIDSTQPIYGLSTRTAVSYASEWARIKSIVSSTQIKLHQRLDFGYSTSAMVRALTTSDAFDLSLFSIRNLTPGTLAATARGISATYWADLRISDVGFKDMDAHAINIIRGVGAIVESVSFLNTLDIENAANTPYCIIASSSQDVGVQNARSRYGRHLFDAGGDTTYGVASRLHIADSIAVEHSASGFGTHAGAIRTTFENCHVHAPFPTAADLSITYETSGFQIRGYDTEIIDCTASGQPNRGVYAVYGADRCRVIGGRFTDCDVGVEFEDSDDCFIGGDALIENPDTNGIVFTRNAAYASAMTKVTVGDIRITGNPSSAGINNGVSGLEVDFL